MRRRRCTHVYVNIANNKLILNELEQQQSSQLDYKVAKSGGGGENGFLAEFFLLGDMSKRRVIRSKASSNVNSASPPTTPPTMPPICAGVRPPPPPETGGLYITVGEKENQDRWKERKAMLTYGTGRDAWCRTLVIEWARKRCRIEALAHQNIIYCYIALPTIGIRSGWPVSVSAYGRTGKLVE